MRAEAKREAPLAAPSRRLAQAGRSCFGVGPLPRLAVQASAPLSVIAGGSILKGERREYTQHRQGAKAQFKTNNTWGQISGLVTTSCETPIGKLCINFSMLPMRLPIPACIWRSSDSIKR